MSVDTAGNTISEIKVRVTVRKMMENMSEMKTMRGMIATVATTIVALSLAGAVATASASTGDFALTQFDAGAVNTQAGAHSDVTTTVGFKSEYYVELFPGFGDTFPNDGGVRTIAMDLPPGLLANAAKAPTCLREDFANGRCPIEAQVGNAEVTTSWLSTPPAGLMEFNPIYNLAPAHGQPASLGLMVGASKLPAYIDIGVDSADDYHVTATSTNIETLVPIKKLKITLWGVPADPIHDSHRMGPNQLVGGYPSAAPPTPFMVNPTDCEMTPVTTLDATSYGGSEVTAQAESPKPTGCENLTFEPTIEVTPETTAPSAATGLTFDLDFPQNDDPDGLATPALRTAVVDLPEGMTINPAVADGLEACTDTESAIGTQNVADCPEAAKIGAVQIDVPALRKPLNGALYIGSQESDDPASGKMFRLFLVANGQGVHLKLEGAVRADPETGQLRATFAGNPQVPVSSIELALKGGPRAVLVTPPTCGPKTVNAKLSSWGGPTVDVKSTFMIDCTPGLGGFDPSFSAGTTSPAAGASSTFSLNIARRSGEQELKSIRSVKLPEGLLGRVASVPLCDQALAAVGSCPDSSRVGRVAVAVGAGLSPLWVPEAGKEPTGVYLTGPYNGAPYGLSIKVPAQAGPFDLGTVVVRAALHVDERTAAITSGVDESRLIARNGAVTEILPEALPRILQGVVLNQREIRLIMDREGFMVNPTDCSEQQITADLAGYGGGSAAVASRFTAVNCARLGFAPRFGARILNKGRRSTLRSFHPRTRFAVVPRRGDANIGGARVVLPSSTLLDQANIGTTCTRAQMAARECPDASVVGYARAWSPLLREAVQGPVYLAANGGVRPLPDLAAVLDGEIRVVLQGEISTLRTRGKARLQNTFRVVPDAPVSRFALTMRGGKNRGLLVNSTDLCRTGERGVAVFHGQNGKRHRLRPRVATRFKGCRKVRRQAAHKKLTRKKAARKTHRSAPSRR